MTGSPAARARHQAVQLAQAAAVGVLVGAQHAERRAQFPLASALASSIASQRGRHLLAALARQVHRDARLDLDHRDAVRQRVVQFAGDAQPLLHGLAAGRLVAGALRLFRALLHLADVHLPHPECHRHAADRDEPSGVEEPSRAAIRAHGSSLRGPPRAHPPAGPIAGYFPRSTQGSSTGLNLESNRGLTSWSRGSA